MNQLNRNAGFIFALHYFGVDLVCGKFPNANTLTMGLFSVNTQHDRETISKRTKEALATKQAHIAQSLEAIRLESADVISASIASYL